MFQGRYEILLDGKRDDRLKIPSEIVIEDAPSRVVISRDGSVEILTDSEARLRALELIARIAIRHATGWNDFELRRASAKDLGTGKDVQMGFYGDIWVSSHTIDAARCEDAVNCLFRASFGSLVFLSNSVQISARPEVAALVALTALEIELGEIVRDEDLQVVQKIAVLEYLKALPAEQIAKLRKLNTLRNKLAHGEWIGVKFETALGNALGGSPGQWVTHGHMKESARHQVTEEVMKALSVLSHLKPT